MSSLTCAGKAAVSGSIVMPRIGNWTARLELDAPTAPTGAVDLTFSRAGGAPLRLSGWVRQGTAWHGRAKVVVVGGAGKLQAQIGPRHYAGPPAIPAHVIVDELVADAGERLSAGAGAALEGMSVPSWCRVGGSANDALRAITQALGVSWRVGADGAVWVGAETWPLATDRLVTMDNDGESGVLHVAPAAPTLLPGQVIQGKKIERVVYSVGPTVRAALWYAPEGSAS